MSECDVGVKPDIDGGTRAPEREMCDMYRFIETHLLDGILTVTLNRPGVLNVLHKEAHFELDHVFDAFAANAAQRVAVVRGAGRAFCAGSDLRAYPEVMVPRARKAERYPASGYAGLAERFDLAKPVIAVVDGAALGGGFELALACDIVLATDRASFGLPEPAVGAVALGGGLHRLARQIGLKRAMGLILGGAPISAAEADAMGLVTELVASEHLEATVDRWTSRLLGHSQLALMAAKEAVLCGLDEPTLAQAIAVQDDYPAYARLVQSGDVTEGPSAFLEKRKPVWAAG